MENTKSSKSRMAKCRSNKKMDKEKWEEYLKKDRERKREARNKQKDTVEENHEQRNKKREAHASYVRLWRKKKSDEKKKTPATPKAESPMGTYHSLSTLRKAVAKTNRALPNSPNKKKAVVRQLLKDILPELSENLSKHKRISRALTEDVIQKVTAFYENDTISWQAPGKRDYKSYRIEGRKVQKQKRYMHLNISEAFELFLKENEGLSIAKSKFYDLRPPHVTPVAQTPHNVCVCVLHANFEFLFQAMSPFLNFPQPSSRKLLEELCCDVDSESCMTSSCKKCKYDVNVVLDCEDLSQRIKWKSWKTEESVFVLDQEGELNDVIEAFNSCIETFKRHVFVKRRQAAYFETLKNTLTNKAAVVQIDFAENYAIISQDEIQSAHWHHDQATVFTCCLWGKDETKSYVVVSDDLTHSKQSAWVFLKSIIADVKQDMDLDTLYMFSDNCSGQFKSKYTISNLCYLANDLCVNYVEWNTFAPGHGKGAIDAIGGIAKRTVWNAVKSRRITVGTAYEFFTCLQKETSKINVLYVSKSEIEETNQFLQGRWENAKEVKGIRQLHHFKKATNSHVLAGLTSTSHLRKIQALEDPEKLRYSDVYSDSEEEISPDLAVIHPLGDQAANLKTGTFVLVKVKSEKKVTDYMYVAICQSDQEEGEVMVMFCTSSDGGKKSFIPVEKDLSYVKVEDITEVLEAPNMTLQGNRLYYQFSRSIPVAEN